MNRKYHYAATWAGSFWTHEVDARDETEANATAKIELERALAVDGLSTPDTFDLVYITP